MEIQGGERETPPLSKLVVLLKMDELLMTAGVLRVLQLAGRNNGSRLESMGFRLGDTAQVTGQHIGQDIIQVLLTVVVLLGDQRHWCK